MSAAAAYKPAHGGYPGVVRTGVVRDMSKRAIAAELHSILCGINDAGPAFDVGLCILLEYHTDAEGLKRVRPVLAEAIEAWPEHSGCSAYPVADPSGAYTPERAYVALSRWGNTPYGRARRRLLWHCIDWCEDAMAE